MSRGLIVRFLLVLGLLGGCFYLTLTKEPTLGLDLEGGAQFVFEAEGTDDVPANASNVDKTLEVLRKRVDALGVAESNTVRQGENRILVELPGVTNDEEAQAAEDRIGQTAKLTIHKVLGAPQEPDAKPTAKDGQVLPDEQGIPVEIGPAIISGEEVTGAAAESPQDRPGSYVVSIDFNGKGGDTWATATGEAACQPDGDPKRRMAIVLDDKVISSPSVETTVPCNVGIRGGSTMITGDFSLQEATDLSVLIEGGSLPLELTLVSNRLVGPSLGAAAIDASIEAGVIGIILTGLFIIIVYRLVGLMATIALASYALLAYAFLLFLGATLTLPGLAGFVLAIGMAIDANVLVFERAREEYQAYPSAGLRRALAVGFNKAWTAIIDSNMTTLLAAGLLFIFGSGPIKGFGVTLSIGVVASMISALIVARVLSDLAISNKPMSRRPALSGIGDIGKVRRLLDEKKPDVVKRSKLWLGIAGVLTVLALAGIFGKGLNLGVEFQGGRQLDYSVSKDVDVNEARAAVTDAGFPTAVVQTAETADFTVRVGEISDEEELKIREELAKIGGDVTKEDDQKIGASLGKELRNNALIAFGLAFAAQMLYLAIRFKWTFGLSAIIAMFHDVIVVVGLFAWMGKPIDGIFLAAAMTIVGLSVNDTVVVFDRVRERWWSSKPGDTFAEQANLAAVETIPRTVNTGLGSMFILAALAVLGGDSLRDFSIALLIGLVVGTYSSIFIATPLQVYLHETWPMSRVKKEKAVRAPDDSGAVV
ncbi:MAG: protein translocase subunit SecD [Nocardioides sp.]|nr:protein translocase subunit SecD [Nocardioides sp.]